MQNAIFVETSAKTAVNVSALFLEISTKFYVAFVLYSSFKAGFLNCSFSSVVRTWVLVCDAIAECSTVYATVVLLIGPSITLVVCVKIAKDFVRLYSLASSPIIPVSESLLQIL